MIIPFLSLKFRKHHSDAPRRVGNEPQEVVGIMWIVVYDKDEKELSHFKTLLEESGHLGTYTTNQLEQLASLMGTGSETSMQFTMPATKMQVSLIILNVDEGEATLDFLKNLKSDLRYKDVPIIVTSESNFEHNVATAYAYGANDFIRKPYDRSEAKARIHACLRLNHEIDRRKARESEVTEIANQLRELSQVLMKLSLIDPLTEIANRRALDKTLDQEFKRSRRNRLPLSLILFDVDHFKLFNDRYGHPAGDLCLKRIAQEVQSTIKRPGDMLTRYGGEEFAIILPSTDTAGAKIMAERIRTTVESLAIRHENNSAAPVVTVSVGISSFDGSDLEFSMEKLLDDADHALYLAKSNGRNRIACTEEEGAPLTASGT